MEEMNAMSQASCVRISVAFVLSRAGVVPS